MGIPSEDGMPQQETISSFTCCLGGLYTLLSSWPLGQNRWTAEPRNYPITEARLVLILTWSMKHYILHSFGMVLCVEWSYLCILSYGRMTRIWLLSVGWSSIGQVSPYITYLLASFKPQLSEQYLDPCRATSTQPGPRHWRGTSCSGANSSCSSITFLRPLDGTPSMVCKDQHDMSPIFITMAHQG